MLPKPNCGPKNTVNSSYGLDLRSTSGMMSMPRVSMRPNWSSPCPAWMAAPASRFFISPPVVALRLVGRRRTALPGGTRP
jgi:hypothetical protein